MSLNSADANRAVLLHSGECILIHCKDTICEFYDNELPEFHTTKVGHTYLTSHRVVFRNRSEADLLSSISIPFIAMKNVSLGEKCILGVVHPQPNGNFSDDVGFKLAFDKGGAVEFIRGLMIASWIAVQERTTRDLPPYTPPTAWYEAGVTISRPSVGQFKWIPEHEAFSTPRPNSVYITSDPSPFPGINKSSYLDFSGSFRDASDHCLQEAYNFSPMDGIFPTFLRQHTQASPKQSTCRDQGI